MSVEPASEADIPAIMAVERTPGFEGLVGRWTREQHEAEMARPSVRYFVLRDHGEVRGFALLQRVGESDGRVHLKRIAIAEPGAGSGGRLLAAVQRWLFTETETNRLDLDVFVANERARRAYEKAGFVVEGRLREYHASPDGGLHDVWFMSILRREWESAPPQGCG